jgi:intracellular sulfur oxidation DsrE/DsrF family protein
MKKLFFVLAVLISTTISAQEKKLKVVWDVVDADTTTTAAVFRQINNALVQVPDLEIEVVFHGPAIFGLMKDSTIFSSRIKVAKQKGVTMAVCNNSMKRYKVDASQLVGEAIIVPSAVVELIKKQSEGWSYLKAAH